MGLRWAKVTCSQKCFLTSPGKTPRKLYFDVVLVGRGSTLSELSMTSFLAPVPAKVELALAKLVASRIGVPTA